ncbi:hypothetical protein SAMN02745150_00561 [Brevinema andersonii]|uniref:Uncharacterized protein n=1 Tax=Brevinema andersonii TaxID=34097 RepID=A0A1I1DPV7_BREAD|nr:hypothetical protein [Brevinema andersonii]SFB74593.1 hypothetical protein SAMN02745150_00561 [Brevinema andersonii]
MDSKRIDLGVINTIGNSDSVVSLYDFQTTTPRRVYDPEETTEYYFHTDQHRATIYKFSGDINSTYTFDLVMIENISTNEDIFQLANGPPSASGFDRWFYGMKVHNNNIVITSNATKDAAKTAMQNIQATDDNAAHFRRKSSVPGNNSQILSDLRSDRSIVLLD